MATHDNSAKYYDFVFQNRFGSHYTELTRTNIQKIQQILPKGKILDFGAGTGRISIPLAEMGYQVSAVEISEGMLAVLKQKALLGNLNIETVNQAYELMVTDLPVDGFDLAFSIFTVLAYINDEEVLHYTLKQIWDKLKPGGLLMFDLVKREGYEYICTYKNGIANKTDKPNFKELVTMQFDPNNKMLCNYHEVTSGIDETGNEFNYTENFQIRFWKLEELTSMLVNVLGMQQIEHFNLANADYYIFKK